jgi:eukaryotic-like serine/threonine-protein kinase
LKSPFPEENHGIWRWKIFLFLPIEARKKMSNKIGRFEILSESTHSDLGSVYKATDEVSGQTVALKTIKLEPLSEQAAALVSSVQEEVASSKVLNSHNIAVLYGAEEIEGQLCASMEYVQGNSIATMMARKEGFSVWDLMDIARQSCQGLDHARGHKVAHHSLEPAKIMVQWDGIVKILSYGISTMGSLAVNATGTAPEVLHYMSPEQLRGDPLDARSNLFSLGAILYEMVTERKAFDGDEADQVRQSISEMTPPPPDQINRKAHPVLSQVIMKALAKDPEERYQSGQDMVNDLERCKESPVKATATAAKPAPAAPKAPAPQKYTAAGNTPTPKAEIPAAKATVSPRVAAAAAGAGGAAGTSSRKQKTSASGAGEISADAVVKAAASAARAESPKMSAAAAAPAEADPSQVSVDPMMDESRTTNDKAGRSFSEINELPPMKEIYVAPAPPPPSEEAPEAVDAVKTAVFKNTAPEKPKVQPREVARKAVTEIKKTPPKLFFYSIAGAVGIILIIVVGIAFHIHSENSDDDGAPAQSTAATAPAQPAPAQVPAPQAQVAVPLAQQVAPEPVTTTPPVVSVKPKYAVAKNKGKSKTPPIAPMIVPGQLNVSSTPEGAQVTVDGRNDPSWATPYNMAGLTPGQHTIVVTKPGFSSETRNVEVASGSKSFLVVQLAQLSATLSVASTPAGASIFMDGKDTGKVTPAQFSVDKAGSHSFAFKKQGYLEESTTATLQIGQTIHLSPTLTALGTTNDIKIGGKFKKMFGGNADTAGMGEVSVKTQPKGAQIAINNRIVDKNSPVDFSLNPGAYVVDITLSGFKSVHKVINVDKSGKVVVDEILERE